MGAGLADIERQREAIRAAARRHRATAISVFGSVARGEDGPTSDIDFLVEFRPDASLLDVAELEAELEQLLGRRIDVVSAGGLKPRDAHLRAEAIPV